MVLFINKNISFKKKIISDMQENSPYQNIQ